MSNPLSDFTSEDEVIDRKWSATTDYGSEIHFAATDRRLLTLNADDQFKDYSYDHISSVEVETDVVDLADEDAAIRNFLIVISSILVPPVIIIFLVAKAKGHDVFKSAKSEMSEIQEDITLIFNGLNEETLEFEHTFKQESDKEKVAPYLSRTIRS
jgi:hypothetical protein